MFTKTYRDEADIVKELDQFIMLVSQTGFCVNPNAALSTWHAINSTFMGTTRASDPARAQYMDSSPVPVDVRVIGERVPWNESADSPSISHYAFRCADAAFLLALAAFSVIGRR